MSPDAVACLRAAQEMSGFFASDVAVGGSRHRDANGFSTAQVLRALGDRAPCALGPTAHATALDALEGCRNPATGAFRFWPLDSRPGWAPTLPDDADDTALIALLLHRAGRMDRAALRRLACKTVVCHRLAAAAGSGPPWIRRGAFGTWMRQDSGPDIADCTVNANVLGLLAAAGLRRVPGYAAACAMIDAAVFWACESADRAAAVSPFYPEPGELVLAVEAAVGEGVAELLPVLDKFAGSPLWQAAKAKTLDPEPVICGSPYGRTRWSSAAVGLSRLIAGRIAPASNGSFRR